MAEQSSPRALTPEGNADTFRPVTLGHTLAQPSTHHMFLLECHDTSPCLLHAGPRTLKPLQGQGSLPAPFSPFRQTQGVGFGTLPSD